MESIRNLCILNFISKESPKYSIVSKLSAVLCTFKKYFCAVDDTYSDVVSEGNNRAFKKINALLLPLFCQQTLLSTSKRVFYLFIMLFCPLQFFQQIAQVTFKWNVVFPWLQLIIKMLIVDGVLLQHYTVSCQQVRQSICCHCAININLVFVLEKK